MFKTLLKSILLLTILVSVPAISGFSFNWNFGVEEIPMYIIGMDKNASNFYSFFNILNAGVNLNVDDNLGLKFRLKYTFFGMTNVNTADSNGVLVNNQNKLYVDRLSIFYNSDLVNILAGRDVYFENDGMLIGNLADGADLDFNLLGFKEKVYVYYSGLLPKDVNQFSSDLFDATNEGGANRLSAGLVLQKYGFLTKSISLMGLYTMDMTTNKYFNPFYAALMSDGIIGIPQLSYNVTAALEVGSLTSNTNILGGALNISIYYMVLDDPAAKLVFTGQFAMASGNSTNTTNMFYGFNSFGKFNTGFVLNPDFANLMFFRLGAVVKLLDDHLDIKANYYYLTRTTTNDTVSGFYSDTTNAQVGNEISGSVNYEIDPDFSVFLNAGYLFGNLSMTTEKMNIFKVYIGVDLKI